MIFAKEKHQILFGEENFEADYLASLMWWSGKENRGLISYLKNWFYANGEYWLCFMGKYFPTEKKRGGK
jgi:hypothetical protein